MPLNLHGLNILILKICVLENSITLCKNLADENPLRYLPKIRETHSTFLIAGAGDCDEEVGGELAGDGGRNLHRRPGPDPAPLGLLEVRIKL